MRTRPARNTARPGYPPYYHRACHRPRVVTLTDTGAVACGGFCQNFRGPVSPYPLAIHSGGQTGVDRAALDAALAVGVPTGGWCPRGRRAEDGPIPARYGLRETPSADYAERTGWNVRDADATLVLTKGDPADGTALTLERARASEKPLFVIDLGAEPDLAVVADWLGDHEVRTLNVAGPRESTVPGIYDEAFVFMTTLLRRLGY